MGSITTRFKLPGVALLVVHKPRIVIAFVEVFEHRGEDLGLLVGKGDTLVGCLNKLSAARSLKEGRDADDVFMSGEKTLISTYD